MFSRPFPHLSRLLLFLLFLGLATSVTSAVAQDGNPFRAAGSKHISTEIKEGVVESVS